MLARGSSAVIVNHRVALSGTKARSAVTSNRVEYIATRPGCDRAATEADVERVREREALVGYVGCRPGSTALFDADGAVSLAEARRRLDACGGAIVCSVVAVRREDCERFGLDTKEGWQAFARANLTREYARLMGITESRVGWVAPHHLNSPANQHIHILTFDKEGGFDRLLAGPDIERARENLTEAAIRPEVERLGVARELARDNAARAAKASPELRRALGDYSGACREITDLRGLSGVERAAYLAKVEADMRSLACNAALREIVPDRTERPADPHAPRAAPTEAQPPHGGARRQ